jgi:hypothetical protein
MTWRISQKGKKWSILDNTTIRLFDNTTMDLALLLPKYKTTHVEVKNQQINILRWPFEWRRPTAALQSHAWSAGEDNKGQ